MLSFILVAVTLGGLAYYFLRGEKDRQPKQTEPKGTANRDRTLDRQAPGETGRPEIHRPKVESAAAETLQRAEDRADDLLRRGGEEKLAWESYFLAESIQEMFARSEFFEGRRRFDSFRTALKAAEDARDKLIESRREEARRKEMASAERPGHLRDMYVRNAVESTLVVAWCAGGLLGKSRRESAREAGFVSSANQHPVDSSYPYYVNSSRGLRSKNDRRSNRFIGWSSRSILEPTRPDDHGQHRNHRFRNPPTRMLPVCRRLPAVSSESGRLAPVDGQ